jgi:hypothetical protein
MNRSSCDVRAFVDGEVKADQWCEEEQDEGQICSITSLKFEVKVGRC